MELVDKNGKLIAEVTSVDANQFGCDKGIWLEVKTDDHTKPTICLIKDKVGGPQKGDWYLGFYRDANMICDLAILFSKRDGPIIQVAIGSEVKQISLMDVINKLKSLK
jgi:hypothetical protein